MATYLGHVALIPRLCFRSLLHVDPVMVNLALLCRTGLEKMFKDDSHIHCFVFICLFVMLLYFHRQGHVGKVS